MNLRSLELGRSKLAQCFKTRSVTLCDSANFSCVPGFIDEALLEAPIKVIELRGRPPKKLDEMIENDSFKTSRFIMKNGEIIVAKQLKDSTSHEDQLTRLGYEAKILSFVGYHSNIVELLGMSLAEAKPTLVFRNISDKNLLGVFQRNQFFETAFIEQILSELCDALNYIHEKSIIHNFFRPESVYLRSSSLFYVPVLCNFSRACRRNCSKPFSSTQVQKMKSLSHLPLSVQSGNIKPSISSDVHSFGVLTELMISKHENCRCFVKDQLKKFAMACMTGDCKILYRTARKREFNLGAKYLFIESM